MVTPAPEVIQSLPPVTIQHIMEGPNPWFAFLGTVAISFIALVVGLITLSRVNRQIKIANRQLGLAEMQLGLANDQIAIAREELSAVRDDLSIATEMRALALRTPDLILNWELGVESNQKSDAGVWGREAYLTFGISNKGTKIAKGVNAEILFSGEGVFAPEDSETRIVNGANYIVYRLSKDEVKIPQDNWFANTIKVDFVSRYPRIGFLWRVFDDEYAYPAKEWGREEIVFKQTGIES
jgi:hypothetical protein